MKRAVKRQGADPRTERALRFLVPLLQFGGALQYSEIRRQARQNGIKEDALYRAANEADVVFITEAGQPVLWQLSGKNPHGATASAVLRVRGTRASA